MKQIWKFFIGLVVAIIVISLAMTVGAVILLGVSIYFGVKYYQKYKADKSSVTPIFKQWWIYTGVLSLLLLLIGFGSDSNKDNKSTKLTVNETFVTNDKGVATISGKTSPDYDVNIDNVKQTAADSDGKFSFEYNLKGNSKKSLRLEVSKDYDDNTKKSKRIYVKPSKKFLANRESLAQESSRAAVASESQRKAASESSESQKKAESEKAKVESEQASDITRLSEKPTDEQSAVLTQLANQTFSKKYPYKGSKIHTILGNIQPWTKDGNVWFAKYEATIANAFNAKRDATLEIRITPLSRDSGNVSFEDY